MSIIARNQKRLKELFYYNKPDQEYGPSQVLIVSLAERHLGFVVTNQSGSEIYSLCYCSMDEGDDGNMDLVEEKYAALRHSYYEVKIIFGYQRNLILPFSEMVGEDKLALLNNLYGYAGPSVAVTESIPAWQLKNSYAVPDSVFDWVRKKYPSAKYLHQHSVSLMNLKPSPENGKLLVDFRPGEFQVTAERYNKFLFARTFEYETPDDVLFYLLRLCEQFSLSPKDVSLELSGLIEKESSLFKELYQYFIHIDFRDAGWGAVNDYPAHFFTSFNDMMQCGS